MLLDPTQAPQIRHTALTALEAADAGPLIAILGVEHSGLEIQTSRGDRAQTGILLRGSQLHKTPGCCPEITRFSLQNLKLDRSRARRWLAEVGRFSPAKISVNGRPIAPGYAPVLARFPLPSPLVGTLSIPKQGHVATIWITLDGIVSAQTTLVDVPCFEAVIEARTQHRRGDSPADLRALAPKLKTSILGYLGRQLLALAEGLPPTPRPQDDERRIRLTHLLLHDAMIGLLGTRIAPLPLFLTIDAQGLYGLASQVGLQTMAYKTPEDRSILSLFPSQRPNDYLIASALVILDEHTRSLLSKSLNLLFRTPPTRRSTFQIIPCIRRAFRSLHSLRLTSARSHLSTLFEFFGPAPKPIPQQELTQPENNFLRLIQLHGGHQGLSFCAGSGALRHRGQRIWLPRDNLEIRACVNAVALDEAWLYPVLLSLFTTQKIPAGARKLWDAPLRIGDQSS